MFPILSYNEKRLENILIDCVFKAVSIGDSDKVLDLIDSFGIDLNIQNDANYNMFEQAVFAGQFDMMRLLKENLGILSHEDYLLIRAARQGRVDILEYLHNEVGLHTSKSDLLLKHALKSGCLDVIKFIRFEMEIFEYKGHEILELAIFKSVNNMAFENLEFLLTYFQMKFDAKKIMPMGDVNPPPKYCIFYSLCKAANANDVDFLRFCFYILKLDFSTYNTRNEKINYLELLQISVKI